MLSEPRIHRLHSSNDSKHDDFSQNSCSHAQYTCVYAVQDNRFGFQVGCNLDAVSLNHLISFTAPWHWNRKDSLGFNALKPALLRQCQRLAMEIWISVASNCFEKAGILGLPDWTSGFCNLSKSPTEISCPSNATTWLLYRGPGFRRKSRGRCKASPA